MITRKLRNGLNATSGGQFAPLSLVKPVFRSARAVVTVSRVFFPKSTDLATKQTKRERHLATARANLTTGLTNGRAANCPPEVEFSRFRALSRRQMTIPFSC